MKQSIGILVKLKYLKNSKRIIRVPRTREIRWEGPCLHTWVQEHLAECGPHSQECSQTPSPCLLGLMKRRLNDGGRPSSDGGLEIPVTHGLRSTNVSCLPQSSAEMSQRTSCLGKNKEKPRSYHQNQKGMRSFHQILMWAPDTTTGQMCSLTDLAPQTSPGIYIQPHINAVSEKECHID